MSAPDGLPVVAFRSRQDLEAWLVEHHASRDGLWLRIAKKDSGIETVSYPEALEAALCYGWIDGQRRRLDGTCFLQRFTPRRARSPWSKINRERASRLIEEGRMHPAGLAEVERAKADGRWEAAYDGQSAATVPGDLQRELDANTSAGAFFVTLDSRNRYAILYRIQNAKRPETRARRIREYVAMLSEQKKIHP